MKPTLDWNVMQPMTSNAYLYNVSFMGLEGDMVWSLFAQLGRTSGAWPAVFQGNDHHKPDRSCTIGKTKSTNDQVTPADQVDIPLVECAQSLA